MQKNALLFHGIYDIQTLFNPANLNEEIKAMPIENEDITVATDCCSVTPG